MMKALWTIVWTILSLVVLSGTIFGPSRTVISISALTALAAPVSVAKSKTVLNQLIEGARKEGQVDIFSYSTASEEVAQSFRQYLQEKFDLQIKLNLEIGDNNVKASQAVGETRQGIAPTYDVQFDRSTSLIQLLEVKGIKHIDNVEQLLSEIAPQALPVLDKLSPGPFRGRAFTFGDFLGVITYNPKLISAAELPKTHKELGDPKYKGMFAIPPWPIDALAAILVYGNEEALEIAKGFGANKAAVEREVAAVNRMLLGEFKFVIALTHHYYMYKAKDPNAPIGLAFFRDYTAVNEAMYYVREGARHPNAATLFVLWHLSEKGNQALEKGASLPSLYLPGSKMGQEIRKQIKADNVKLASFIESEESMNKLRWLATPEGKTFLEQLSKAWLGRK